MESTIQFRQLKLRGAGGEFSDEGEMDVKKAAGASDFKSTSINRLNRIIPLSGMFLCHIVVLIFQFDLV